jgi:ectoine hydroxylase-related dioxygenase (phytanoyl-CoA dioxygenase family)
MNEMQRMESGYYDPDACDLRSFEALIAQRVDTADVPNAAEVINNIPVYDMVALRPRLEDQDSRRALMAEWARVLKDGSGVLVLRAAYADTSAIDAATAVFERIIAREKSAGEGKADHFAAAGSNDRIWNSLQKLCMEDPGTFLRYHGNASIDAVCEAWLGPNYQMTAQVNLVRPGGAAQQAHRDYHLGFQTAEVSAQYPAHVHDLSPLMTLQGGIAHGSTPVEAGPTKLLPFSQLYRPGYAAWRRADFRASFEKHHVQLPLEKGDALFFNPALFHAAGANRSSDVQRLVNLLQVSSAFGRAMESIDRAGMSRKVFAPLKHMAAAGTLKGRAFDAAIAATAEGYSFPTNLDRDPPVGGLAPRSQAALLRQAVLEDWQEQAFFDELAALARRQLP